MSNFQHRSLCKFSHWKIYCIKADFDRKKKSFFGRSCYWDQDLHLRCRSGLAVPCSPPFFANICKANGPMAIKRKRLRKKNSSLHLRLLQSRDTMAKDWAQSSCSWIQRHCRRRRKRHFGPRIEKSCSGAKWKQFCECKNMPQRIHM